MKKAVSIPITRTQSTNIVKGVKAELGLTDDSLITINLKRRKLPPIPNYAMIFQANGMLMLKEIAPSTMKVFFLMLCKLQYSNHVGINQQTVVEETGLAIDTVKKAIKELRIKNMVLSYPDMQDHRRNIYIINPYIAWKGTSKARIESIMKLQAEDPNQLQLPCEQKTDTVLPQKHKK